MIGAASAGGLGRPMSAPMSEATKNQKSTAAKVQRAADQKKARGDGKKETNIG